MELDGSSGPPTTGLYSRIIRDPYGSGDATLVGSPQDALPDTVHPSRQGPRTRDHAAVAGPVGTARGDTLIGTDRGRPGGPRPVGRVVPGRRGGGPSARGRPRAPEGRPGASRAVRWGIRP